MSKTKSLSAVIVDDHPLARMAIKNLLESEGISVIGEAGDGQRRCYRWCSISQMW